MAKYSPWPWAYTEHSWSDTSICDDNGRQLALLSIEDEATEETQYELSERALADARLMAAAPDLLDALSAMVNKATKQNWNDMYPEQLKQAFEAIGKATGEKP